METVTVAHSAEGFLFSMSFHPQQARQVRGMSSRPRLVGKEPVLGEGE